VSYHAFYSHMIFYEVPPCRKFGNFLASILTYQMAITPCHPDSTICRIHTQLSLKSSRTYIGLKTIIITICQFLPVTRDNQLKAGYIIIIFERGSPLDEAAGYKSEVASSANAQPKTEIYFLIIAHNSSKAHDCN